MKISVSQVPLTNEAEMQFIPSWDPNQGTLKKKTNNFFSE